MKNRLVILVLVVILFSCNKNNSVQKSEEWILIQMSGQMMNSEKTGANMGWQESYLLKSNGTFVKFRKRNGTQKEALGTFKIEELSDGKYLTLTHDKNNSLIGNCDSGLKEVLKYETDDKLRSSWWACDGPGLLYERKDKNTDDK